MCYFFLVILLSLGLRHVSSISTTFTPVQSGISSSDKKPSCDDAPKTNAGRLKKHLFCGYDPSIRPVAHHSNATDIKLAAFPTNIVYVTEERNLVWMTFTLYLQWKDDLLEWDPTKYEGLGDFYTDGSRIWVPDIFVSDPPQSQLSRQMSCNVHYTGNVECSMYTSVTARCDFDLTYFPHDQHSCKIVFRPRSYKGNVLNLDFFKLKGMDPLKFYRSHGTWNMVSLKTSRNTTTLYSDLFTINMEYTFVIERRSSTYNVTYATPALVLMMMVTCVFWLEAQCSARIILPALTVISHMVVIQWLMKAINANFEHLPVIIMLFRDSLLLAGLALVWSVISRALCTSPSSPYWLYAVITKLRNIHFVKLLMPHDIFLKSEVSGDEDESSLVVQRDCVEQQWRILTILLDRIFFALYVLIYMYLFMRLSP